MGYFIRPSKAELSRINEEIIVTQEFMELIDKRVSVLTAEKLKLDAIINKKRLSLEGSKKNIEDKSNKVLEKYGSLELKRITHFTKKNLEVKLKNEYIAGIRYQFPFISKKSKIIYPLSMTGFGIDSLYTTTNEFMDNIIDFSKYTEARKRISKELKMIKRKLNNLKNIILPDLISQKKATKKFLMEKERFDTVTKMSVINSIKQ